MKINTSQIYLDYLRYNNQDKVSLLESIKDYNKTKEYLLEKLKVYEHYIINFTNINYANINDLDRLISEKSLIHLVDIAGVDINSIRRTINIIVTINKDLNKIEEKLQAIKDNYITEDLFKEVLYKFNNKISDEIVYKGYTFKLGGGLGFIRIKKVNAIYNRDGSLRTKKRINWGESNKLKAELIKEGKIPYQVLTRDEEGKILTHNGGENWFIYHSNDFDYLWNWNKNRCATLNSAYYKFKPTIYNNNTKDGNKLGNINKLKQLVTANSPLLSNFSEILLESNNKKGLNGRNHGI